MAWTVAGNIKGPKGDKGDTGDTGATGAAGSGVTIKGTDTWTNIDALSGQATGDMWILSADDASAPEASGESGGGEKGDGLVWDGTTWTNVGPIRGPDGTAATIAVGTVTGLAAGSTPTITNAGTSAAAVFNFGLPAGAQGATGTTGATGDAATVTAGTATALSAGASPTVSNSGTTSAAVFNFGIPAGAKGDTGDTGGTGARGSKWFTGSGAPGTVSGAVAGDEYLDTDSGDLYTLS